MKKILIIFLVLFSITSCDKNGWEDIAEGTDPEGDKFILALNKTNIKVSEKTKTGWLRQSFTNPKAAPNGSNYRELFIHFTVNCGDKKFIIKTIGMSNPDSNDFVHSIDFLKDNPNPIWKDIPEGKPSKAIYDELCVWYKSFI